MDGWLGDAAGNPLWDFVEANSLTVLYVSYVLITVSIANWVCTCAEVSAASMLQALAMTWPPSQQCCHTHFPHQQLAAGQPVTALTCSAHLLCATAQNQMSPCTPLAAHCNGV